MIHDTWYMIPCSDIWRYRQMRNLLHMFYTLCDSFFSTPVDADKLLSINSDLYFAATGLQFIQVWYNTSSSQFNIYPTLSTKRSHSISIMISSQGRQMSITQAITGLNRYRRIKTIWNNPSWLIISWRQYHRYSWQVRGSGEQVKCLVTSTSQTRIIL